MHVDCRGRTSLSRPGHRATRAGFALPAALLLLLLIAALIAGAFSATSEETRIGAAAADRQLALLGAESAIEVAVTTLPASFDEPMSVGETRSRSVEGLSQPVVVHSTRLDSSDYWLVAESGSTSVASGIARRIGVLVRVKKWPDGSMTIDRIPERAWSELF